MKQQRTSPNNPPQIPHLVFPRDLQPLFDLTQASLGKTEGVAEHLYQVVATITQGYALLELPMVPLHTAISRPHHTIPLIYHQQQYGVVHLVPDPVHPHRPALSIEQGTYLADAVAQQYYLLELSALVQHLLSCLPGNEPEPLTPQEQYILAHLMHGETKAAIAGQLAIKEQTVKKHLEHIHQKLGVGTQLDMIVVAYQRHLVHPLAPLPQPAAPSKNQPSRKRIR